jgi:DNA modification methylase
MGTGMTGLVAKDLKRNYLGCEIDKNFTDKSLTYL